MSVHQKSRLSFAAGASTDCDAASSSPISAVPSASLPDVPRTRRCPLQSLSARPGRNPYMSTGSKSSTFSRKSRQHGLRPGNEDCNRQAYQGQSRTRTSVIVDRHPRTMQVPTARYQDQSWVSDPSRPLSPSPSVPWLSTSSAAAGAQLHPQDNTTRTLPRAWAYLDSGPDMLCSPEILNMNPESYRISCRAWRRR